MVYVLCYMYMYICLQWQLGSSSSQQNRVVATVKRVNHKANYTCYTGGWASYLARWHRDAHRGQRHSLKNGLVDAAGLFLLMLSIFSLMGWRILLNPQTSRVFHMSSCSKISRCAAFSLIAGQKWCYVHPLLFIVINHYYFHHFTIFLRLKMAR